MSGDLELRLHINYHGLKATQYFTKFTAESQAVLRQDLLTLKLPHPKKDQMVLLSHGLVECVWYNVQPNHVLHKNVVLKSDQADEKTLRQLSISSLTYKEIWPNRRHGVKRTLPADERLPAPPGAPRWAAPAVSTSSTDGASQRPSKYARVDRELDVLQSQAASHSPITPTSTSTPYSLPPKPKVVPPPPIPADPESRTHATRLSLPSMSKDYFSQSRPLVTGANTTALSSTSASASMSTQTRQSAAKGKEKETTIRLPAEQHKMDKGKGKEKLRPRVMQAATKYIDAFGDARDDDEYLNVRVKQEEVEHALPPPSENARVNSSSISAQKRKSINDTNSRIRRPSDSLPPKPTPVPPPAQATDSRIRRPSDSLPPKPTLVPPPAQATGSASTSRLGPPPPAPLKANAPLQAPFKPAPSALTPVERAELEYQREMGRRQQMKKAKEIAGVTGAVPGSGVGAGVGNGKDGQVKKRRPGNNTAPMVLTLKPAHTPISIVSSREGSSMDLGSSSPAFGPPSSSSSSIRKAPAQVQPGDSFRVKEEPVEVLLPPPPPPAAPTPLFLPSTSEADMEVDMGMDMEIEQDTSVDRFMSAVSEPALEGGITGQEQRDPSETESQMADRVVKDALKTLQIKKESLSISLPPSPVKPTFAAAPTASPLVYTPSRAPSAIRPKDVLETIDVEKIANSASIPWDLISVALSTASTVGQTGSGNSSSVPSNSGVKASTGKAEEGKGAAQALLASSVPASAVAKPTGGPSEAVNVRSSRPGPALPAPPLSANPSSVPNSIGRSAGDFKNSATASSSSSSVGVPSGLPAGLQSSISHDTTFGHARSDLPVAGITKATSTSGPLLLPSEKATSSLGEPFSFSSSPPKTTVAVNGAGPSSASSSQIPTAYYTSASRANEEAALPQPQGLDLLREVEAQQNSHRDTNNHITSPTMGKTPKTSTLRAQRPAGPYRQETITNLTREACDIKRQVSALLAREEVVFDELERLGANSSWLPERASKSLAKEVGEGKLAGYDEERMKEKEIHFQARIKFLEKQLAEESQRREEAENAIKDVRRELKAPFVVPSLLDAFVDLSKLTTKAMRRPAPPTAPRAIRAQAAAKDQTAAGAPLASPGSKAEKNQEPRRPGEVGPSSDYSKVNSSHDDTAGSGAASRTSRPLPTRAKDVDVSRGAPQPSMAEDAMQVDHSVGRGYG
ncbi:hypothetical protein CVT26_005894 [Gymnopilus dilepis]|uniref:Uncharacterized protein n=1 Tax=Gymnopilus dilepis TaxID=231916 RepID=A0A409Y1P0_9AGAR|nr:hypothetical protein CVT26_005894 [Gymnopilus dilepis]